MQIALGFRWGKLLMQDAIKINKGRNPHVGSTMNKNAPPFERLYRPAKRTKILSGGRLEIHRDMNVRHAETGYNAALMRKGIIGGRKRQIDDRLKTSGTDCLKLFFGGLASGAEPVTNGTEVIYFGKAY